MIEKWNKTAYKIWLWRSQRQMSVLLVKSHKESARWGVVPNITSAFTGKKRHDVLLRSGSTMNNTVFPMELKVANVIP